MESFVGERKKEHSKQIEFMCTCMFRELYVVYISGLYNMKVRSRKGDLSRKP